jgi:hypothetical protein
MADRLGFPQESTSNPEHYLITDLVRGVPGQQAPVAVAST